MVLTITNIYAYFLPFFAFLSEHFLCALCVHLCDALILRLPGPPLPPRSPILRVLHSRSTRFPALAETTMSQIAHLRTLIRDVPDFPKPGIMFRDFTPLLRDPAGLALAVELMVNPFRGKHVDLVAGAESRGFIFGTAMAQSLSAGFVPIRKPGKLPAGKAQMGYELEYGADKLEIHVDAVQPGQRIVLVDDLLATGGTMEACCKLVKSLGAEIAGISVLIELRDLSGRDKLARYGEVRSVIQY